MSVSEPSGDRFTTWIDLASGATEFVSAHFRSFEVPPHVHETFTVGIVESGGLRFRSGRTPAVISPAGTLWAINPRVVHGGGPAAPAGLGFRMFYPPPALILAALEESRRRPVNGEWRLADHAIDDPELYGEFASLHLSSQLGEPLLERQIRVAAFLRRLFVRHGDFLPEASRARVAPRTVAIVRDYLHAESHSEVSIADLAKAAGVSSTQVIRAFSAATGMPPHSYLISLRVERAKALLRAGSSPAATALQVGFSDQSQMTRHFKRLTGTTPGRFAAEAAAPGRGRGDSERRSAGWIQRPASARRRSARATLLRSLRS